MEGLPKAGGWICVNQIVPTEKPVHRFGIYFAKPTGKYYFEGERHAANIFKYIPHEWDYPYNNLIDIYTNNQKHTEGLHLMKIDIWNFCRSNPNHEPINHRGWNLLEQIGKEDLEKNLPIVQQVKVMTEHGEIYIQPEEYVICTEEKLAEYMEAIKDNHCFMVYLSDSRQLKGKVADQVFYLRSRGISYSTALQMSIGAVSTSNLFYLYMHPGYVEYFTREPQLSEYYKGHLIAMLNSKRHELAGEYLNQIQQIKGYEEFKI